MVLDRRYRSVCGIPPPDRCMGRGCVRRVREVAGMGKKRPRHPTLAEKKAISKAGLLPENWWVQDADNNAVTLISKRSGQRRVILL